jgi:hypothetical protein
MERATGATVLRARLGALALGMEALHVRSHQRWLGLALLLLLSLLAVWRSAAGTRLDSFTVDEPWHVVAGTALPASIAAGSCTR